MRYATSIAVFVFLAVALPQRSDARTFMEFLRAVGNTIAHPQPHPKSTSTTHTKHASTKAKTADSNAATEQPSPPVSGSNPPTLAPAASPNVEPEPTVRAAVALPGAPTRRDLPYGVPAPNKAGFVTSPYAPRAGLVDVRGFPSGTEVKDPYTGKAFLAP